MAPSLLDARVDRSLGSPDHRLAYLWSAVGPPRFRPCVYLVTFMSGILVPAANEGP
jgi:hypothetical protein